MTIDRRADAPAATRTETRRADAAASGLVLFTVMLVFFFATVAVCYALARGLRA